MLMAAGMDAQQLEAKLVGEVKAAKDALLAEMNPANKAELRMMWKEAKDDLNSFRRQQVAGGEDPDQGCRRVVLHAVRQQGVRLAGGAVQGPATSAGRGLRA